MSNNTLDYFVTKLNIDLNLPSPIVLRYGRNHIIEAFRDLNFTVGAEVGTDRGLYAQKICASNPQIKLYCIDPWAAYTYYHPHKLEATEEDVEASHAEAVQRLVPYNCEILRLPSVEGVKRFKPDSLDFVFIDGNHSLPYIAQDIACWSPVVRPGGIVYGHDYLDDVKVAVDAYMAAQQIKPWFLLHRGGKLIICWMYIR